MTEVYDQLESQEFTGKYQAKPWSNLSWKQLAVRMYVVFVVAAVVINVGLYAQRRLQYQDPNSIGTRLLPSEPEGCPLNCGQNGVCLFKNKKERTEPRCLCEAHRT